MVPPTQAAATTGGHRPAPPRHDDAQALQREVQRLFGRCLLQLQQYETLIKHLVANHRLSGPVCALERIRAQRVEDYATKSLGYQIDVLLKSFFTTEAVPHASIDGAASSIGSPAFGYRSTMRLSAEDYARTKAELKRLVDARNDLVHDFSGRFDLQTSSGCAAARDYLDECYARIDVEYRRLCAWVQGADVARVVAEAFMQAPGFSERFQSDAEPDGTMPWEAADIVGALRDAIAELDGGEGEWTRLDHAIAVVQHTHPGKTPEAYGCKSWRQVLNESRVFDLEYRTDGSGRRVAWFRERGW